MKDYDETHQLLALAAAMRQKAARAMPHMRNVYLSLAAKCEAQIYSSSPPSGTDLAPRMHLEKDGPA